MKRMVVIQKDLLGAIQEFHEAQNQIAGFRCMEDDNTDNNIASLKQAFGNVHGISFDEVQKSKRYSFINKIQKSVSRKSDPLLGIGIVCLSFVFIPLLYLSGIGNFIMSGKFKKQ